MIELATQPAVQLFMLCAAILTLKMILTGTITGITRMVKGVFSSSEDFAMLGKTPVGPDEQVERWRRAHQNDLENILPFFAVGLLWALTGPSYGIAWWLFWTFTVARILHTVFYVMGLQPWRSIVFEIASVALLVITVLLLMRVI